MTDRDLKLSHSFLSQLYSLSRGRYCFYETLAALGHPEASPSDLVESEEQVLKIRTWGQVLAADRFFLLDEWTYPETDAARDAVELIDRYAAELLDLANRVIEILTQVDLMSRRADLHLLTAALARHGFMRSVSITELCDFYLRYNGSPAPETAEQVLAQADQSIVILRELIDQMKSSQPITRALFQALVNQCAYLSGAFRSSAHEVNLLLALYRGGISFGSVGISEEEAGDWKMAGFSPEDAGAWRAYSFKADQARAWIDAGVSDCETAFGRHYRHGRPEQVSAA